MLGNFGSFLGFGLTISFAATGLTSFITGLTTGLTTGFTTGSGFLIGFGFGGGGDWGFDLIGSLMITSGDGLRGFGAGRLIGFLLTGGGGESAEIINFELKYLFQFRK